MTSTVIEPSAGDILRHAATLIEEWGWTRHTYLAPNGAMCMSEAIFASAGMSIHELDPHWPNKDNWVTNYSNNKPWRAGRRARQAASKICGDGCFAIVKFNDVRDRTQDEVIQKLLEAAEFADSQGW